MPVKYIGAVLVFLACSSVGFLMASGCRKEERCLAEFIRLLDYMSCELQYRLTPLPQICHQSAQASTGCIQRVLTALAGELEGQISPDANCCMRIAVSTVKDLPNRVKTAFLALGESLGCFDLDGQLLQLAAVKQQCSAELTNMQANADERIRRYQTLGLCAGLGLAILLL